MRRELPQPIRSLHLYTCSLLCRDLDPGRPSNQTSARPVTHHHALEKPELASHSSFRRQPILYFIHTYLFEQHRCIKPSPRSHCKQYLPIPPRSRYQQPPPVFSYLSTTYLTYDLPTHRPAYLPAYLPTSLLTSRRPIGFQLRV